jgi:hypothetical protein
MIMKKNDNYNMVNVERYIGEALKATPEIAMSEDFTSILLKKIEHKIMLNEILKEFGIKLALIAGVLVFAGVIMVLLESTVPNFLLQNLVQIIYIILFLLFIFFMDDVMLKVLFYKKSLSWGRKKPQITQINTD